jgi:hypothetical protein
VLIDTGNADAPATPNEVLPGGNDTVVAEPGREEFALQPSSSQDSVCRQS